MPKAVEEVKQRCSCILPPSRILCIGRHVQGYLDHVSNSKKKKKNQIYKQSACPFVGDYI